MTQKFYTNYTADISLIAEFREDSIRSASLVSSSHVCRYDIGDVEMLFLGWQQEDFEEGKHATR